MSKSKKPVLRPTCSFADYLALAVATVIGVGKVPYVSGTCGSLVGVLIYLTLRWIQPIDHSSPLQASIILMGLLLLTSIGIWSASRTEKILNQKDSGIIVIDEVVGQLITYLFVPFRSGIFIICAGFLLFRLFDIWKPYPIKSFESLKAGLGVVADDVVAGIYAGVALSGIFTLFTLVQIL